MRSSGGAPSHEERGSRAASAAAGTSCLVALTSIHWREAWKYGERAFRYCQHDLGHAIAAVSICRGARRVAGRVAAGLVARGRSPR